MAARYVVHLDDYSNIVPTVTCELDAVVPCRQGGTVMEAARLRCLSPSGLPLIAGSGSSMLFVYDRSRPLADLLRDGGGCHAAYSLAPTASQPATVMFSRAGLSILATPK